LIKFIVFSVPKSLFKSLNIKSFQSDEKEVFVSKPGFKYLKEKHADYYVITEQRHNNLSILNKFTRILLD
jgi:hypothetical protein